MFEYYIALACIILLIYILKTYYFKSNFISIRSNMAGGKIKIWDTNQGWLVKDCDKLNSNQALKISTQEYTVFYKPLGSVEDLPANIGSLPISKTTDLYSSGDIYLEIVPLELAKQEYLKILKLNV